MNWKKLMNIKKHNYIGIDHSKINDTFEGNLTFVNYMCINNKPTAVYHASNPNKKKGHKEYLLIFSSRAQYYVSGMTPEQLDKERMHNGIFCLKCKDVILSLYNHDFETCSCKNAFIDGGKFYTRSGAEDLSTIKSVVVDLLNDKVV